MADGDVRIKASIEGINKVVDDLKKLTGQFKELEKESESLDKGLNQSKRGFDLFGISLKDGNLSIDKSTLSLYALALAAYKVGKESIDSSLKFSGLMVGLEQAAGNSTATNNALNFLSDTSKQLGLNVHDLIDPFKRFAASAKGTALEGAALEPIFKGVASAASVMKLSGEDLKGVFKALSDMMSKGTVSAEELKGQLGDRLPGALGIAAKAMGLTTQELLKMMQEGKILASDLLPKLGAELERTFGKTALDSANTAQASFNRFNEAIENLKITIGQSGLVDMFAALAEGATKLLEVFGGPNEFEIAKKIKEIDISSLDAFSKQLEELYKKAGEAPERLKMFEETVKPKVSAEAWEKIKGSILSSRDSAIGAAGEIEKKFITLADMVQGNVKTVAKSTEKITVEAANKTKDLLNEIREEGMKHFEDQIKKEEKALDDMWKYRKDLAELEIKLGKSTRDEKVKILSEQLRATEKNTSDEIRLINEIIDENERMAVDEIKRIRQVTGTHREEAIKQLTIELFKYADMGDAGVTAMTRITEAIRDVATETDTNFTRVRNYVKETSEEMKGAFTDALEELITKGSSFKEVMGNLWDDIKRIILRKIAEIVADKLWGELFSGIGSASGGGALGGAAGAAGVGGAGGVGDLGKIGAVVGAGKLTADAIKGGLSDNPTLLDAAKNPMAFFNTVVADSLVDQFKNPSKSDGIGAAINPVAWISGNAVKDAGKKIGNIFGWATGTDMIADKPTLFVAGERGSERVSVKPLGATGAGGNQGGGNIQINGPVFFDEITLGRFMKGQFKLIQAESSRFS